MKRIVLVCVCLTCMVSTINSKGQNQNYLTYIDIYKELAISEMEKYRVPASITLAQGLLESGAGRSNLAKYSNNHFGIKCGRSWTGEKTYHNDDRPNECFREYDNVSQSYEDHSLFLTRNPRYAPLFRLDITDYKGWAHGLKMTGYATNPNYAELLVSLIESYELYEYDRQVTDSKSTLPKKEQVIIIEKTASHKKTSGLHDTYITNGIVYIIAQNGDTWEGLAKELGISAKKLRKYNDLYESYRLQKGDIVYLKKKNKKAKPGQVTHIIRAGESMHSISQKYCIQLKCLYKMNRMNIGSATPDAGYILRIR